MNRPELAVLGLLGVSVVWGLSEMFSDSLKFYRNSRGDDQRVDSVGSSGGILSTLKSMCPITWDKNQDSSRK